MRISIDGIKQHPFFESIDWEWAAKRFTDPPFVPNDLEPIESYFPYSKPATNEDLVNGFNLAQGVKPLGNFWPFAHSSKLKDF